MTLKETMEIYWDAHPKGYYVFRFFLVLLYIGFGFIAGMQWNIDDVQESCNQYIFDNFWTLDMQKCLLLGQQDNFILPNGTFFLINDFPVTGDVNDLE